MIGFDAMKVKTLVLAALGFLGVLLAPALASAACIPNGAWVNGIFYDGAKLCAADLNGNNAFLLSQGGSGSVNTGTANQLTYYAGTGKVVSGTSSLPSGFDLSAGLVTATGTTTPNTLATRFSQVVNLKDEGALCNGSADDAIAIQAWLNKAASNIALYAPAGHCVYKTALTMPSGGLSDVAIVGAGPGVTIFDYQGTNATNDVWTIGDGTNNYDQFYLQGFTVEATTSMSAGSLQHFKRLTRSQISNVVWDGQGGPHGNYNGPFFDGVDFVTVNQFQAFAKHDAIDVDGISGGPAADLLVYGGKITGTTVGIHIGGGFGGFVCDNTDISISGIGLLIDNGLTALGNREIFQGPGCIIDSSTGDGVKLDDTISNSGTVQLDGWIASNGGAGVEVVADANVKLSISSPVIWNNAGDGIKIEDSTAFVFPSTGTLVHDNGGWGFNCTVPTGNLLSPGTTPAFNVSGPWSADCGQQPIVTAPSSMTAGDAVIAGAFTDTNSRVTDVNTTGVLTVPALSGNAAVAIVSPNSSQSSSVDFYNGATVEAKMGYNIFNNGFILELADFINGAEALTVNTAGQVGLGESGKQTSMGGPLALNSLVSQCLETNSSGVIVGTGSLCPSGGGTPGGSSTDVQYNNSSAFGGNAGFVYDGTSKITLGVAGTSVGGVVLQNATSGSITIHPPTGALGTVTATIPAASDIITENTQTQTLTNKSIAGSEINSSTVGVTYGGTSANLSATGGAGDVLQQATAGAPVTVGQLAASSLSNGVTGSGAVVLAAAPTFTNAASITAGTGNNASLTVTAPNSSQSSSTNFYNGATEESAVGYNVSGSANVFGVTDFINSATALGISSGGVLTLGEPGKTVALQNVPTIGTTQNVLCVTSGGVIEQQATTCTVSARRYKTHIEPLAHGLDWVAHLTPSTYEEKADGKKMIGLIADDAGTVDKRLAAYNPDGSIQTIQPEAIIAVLTRAIQQQQTEIETLQRQIGGANAANDNDHPRHLRRAR